MMTKVEEVARAIFHTDYPDAGEVEETHWEEKRLWYLDAARAAIEAMRVPTKAMWYEGGILRLSDADHQRIYQAMIDAALKEEQP